jgi:hypothetical protein
MRESGLKKRIVANLNQLPHTKAECRPPGSTTGEPDIHGCCCGLSFQLEVKPPGRDITKPGRAKIQAYRREQWQKAGAVVSVVHSFEEARGVLITAILTSNLCADPGTEVWMKQEAFLLVAEAVEP